MFIRILFAVVAAASLSAPAEAQIYAWRDANGTLVLSDRRGDPDAKTYEVPHTSAFRSTRPVASREAREHYEPLIQAHASRYALAPDLVRAVIQVESGFNPRARSAKGAMGLMQLMPETAQRMGVTNAYDADDNIRGGSGYLRQLLDRYEGNEELALAAYNAGPSAVERYGQRIPPYRETRDYVKKVGSAASKPPRAAQRAPTKRLIYKSIDIVDGRPIVRYSTEKPLSGAYEIVGR